MTSDRHIIITYAYRPMMLALLTAAPVAAATPALASADAAADPAAGKLTIEEVIVTSRKKEENLQKTPIAVTALTTAGLENRTIANITDIANFVPNVQFQAGPAGGSGANFFIRGIGVADWIAALEPGVGSYIDGVYLGRTTGGAFDLLDIERIEVLRGPQGTLFGRNTIGGAVSVITAKPTDALEGEIQGVAGSREKWGAKGWINLPMVEEKLAARLSFRAETQDGYGKRLFDDTTAGDKEIWSARAAVRWHASEDVIIDLSGDYWKRDGGADFTHTLALNQLFFPDTSQYVTSDRYATWSGLQGGNDTEIWGIGATAEWRAADNLTLKSITAYRKLDQSTGVDFDGTPIAHVDQLAITDQHQFSQEFQISGENFDSRLNWLLGLYYFEEKIDQFIPLTSVAFFGGGTLHQDNYHDNKNAAVFAHATYALTDQLNMSAGLRYSYEKKQQTFDHYLDVGIIVPILDNEFIEDSWKKLTPKVGLEYQATDDVLLYVSYSSGFRSGGFNGRPINTASISSYDPEIANVYEAGVKSQLFDNRVQLNLAAFYNDYKDLQLTLPEMTPSGPAIIAQNAAKARIYGFEAEGMMRLTESLDINFGAGYLNAKYKEVDPSAEFTVDDPLITTPKWSFNAGIQYAMPLSNLGTLTMRADYAYRSSFYFFSIGPNARQKAYDIVNLKASFEPDNSKWKIAAYGLNVFDETYALFAQDALSTYGLAHEWVAPPAEWGVELTFRF